MSRINLYGVEYDLQRILDDGDFTVQYPTPNAGHFDFRVTGVTRTDDQVVVDAFSKAVPVRVVFDGDNLRSGTGTVTAITVWNEGERREAFEGGERTSVTMPPTSPAIRYEGLDLTFSEAVSFVKQRAIIRYDGGFRVEDDTLLVDDYVVVGSSGDDSGRSGIGDDVVFLGAGNDVFRTGGGDDRIFGGPGDDQLHAGDGNDILIGGAGRNLLYGGRGNDTYVVGEGRDLVLDGIGEDTVSYIRSPEAIALIQVVFPSAGPEVIGRGGFAEGDSVTGIHRVIGSRYDDRFVRIGAENILAAAGNDMVIAVRGTTVNGGNGDDFVSLVDNGSYSVAPSPSSIYGGSGIDTLSYRALFDSRVLTYDQEVDLAAAPTEGLDFVRGIEIVMMGAGDDVARGSAVDETLIGDEGDDLLEGRGGADTLGGGAGTDTASFESSRAGVTIDAANAGRGTGDAMGDRFFSIERFVGSAHDDVFLGSARGDVVEGGNGDDVLAGMGGNDVLLGGAGADTLGGGTGNDRLEGGAGGDTLFGAAGDDVLFGDAEFAFEVEGGDDRLFGGAGADVLVGGRGDDVLFGQAGRDRLTGGEGDDTLTGGAGRDEFVVGGFGRQTDTVTDFTPGEDVLMVEGTFSVDALFIVERGADTVVYLSEFDRERAVVLEGVAPADLGPDDLAVYF